ncbi:hypothetical protein EPUS_05456 [Endocarpon pusillum Z07020]|uniref:Uncharacterized protein n=1 Tax=Endocarpon pusillum (strain Z07020 / HMAS-L-300199) TaxID=1263415 RepID=U1FYB6_ENDPU|nr:uncharacterized protein EPUS_05456 [Endocarpon pusillum Z07020]ERF69912.1 hypothetical protein EPUS_05456 [Endocarpon pusillum Z07020]
MSDSYDSDHPPTFLSLPSEVRCMIYKEVFAGATIVLPAANVPRRSRRLNGKLIALLQVCRVCHLEATPILYSNAVMKVAGPLAAGTLERGLRNEHFHRIRTIVASTSALDGKQMGRQLKEFRALRKMTFQLGSYPTLSGNADGQAIQLVVSAEMSKLRVSQMYLWIEWLVRSGISVHVAFKIWHWTKPRTSVHYIDYNINDDVTVISADDPFE